MTNERKTGITNKGKTGMTTKKKLIAVPDMLNIIVSHALILAFAAISLAESGDIKLVNKIISAGGNNYSDSGTLQLAGTVGLIFSQTLSSADYTVHTGHMFPQPLYSPQQQLIFWKEDGKVSLEMPPDATTFTLGITLLDVISNPSNINSAVLKESLKKLKDNSGNYRQPIESSIIEIKQNSLSAPDWNGKLNSPGFLKFSYPDENTDSFVDGTNPKVRAESLEIWYLNEARGLWSKLPDTHIDATSKTVAAQTRNFGVFGLFGAPEDSLAQAYAYPVPWRPNDSDLTNGTSANGITFTNLASECAIRIYTVSGELVNEISHTGGLPDEKWNVTTKGGQPVASGVYIWRLTSPGDSKTGKLMVIR